MQSLTVAKEGKMSKKKPAATGVTVGYDILRAAALRVRPVIY